MHQALHFNPASLSMVKGELLTSLQEAEQAYETYLGEPEQLDPLHVVHDRLLQVRGTFRLLQIQGADLVAEGMAELASALKDGRRTLSESLATAMSRGFMVLTRYLDYLQRAQLQCPVLLHDMVNELRQVAGASLIAEAHFSLEPLPDLAARCVLGEGDAVTFARLKHLYQAGLLELLRNGANGGNCGLMQRGLDRIADLLGEGCVFPWLLAAVVEALGNGGLNLSISRKRLLGTAERSLKLGTSPSAALCHDLVYLVAVSDTDGPAIQRARSSLGIPATPCDGKLAAERKRMLGPSHDAIIAMAVPLRDEIHALKEALEVASSGENGGLETRASLAGALRRIADVLALVDLTEPAAALREHLLGLESLPDGPLSVAYVNAVAGSLLFVESALDRLTAPGLGAASVPMDHDALVALTELQQAERIVIAECLAGLGVAKRAISAYVDANFDPIHMANVAVTLNAVRGGMEVLGLTRAAMVLKSCVAFINAKIQRSVSPVTQKQWLDTLADALISVEYYIDALHSNLAADTKVLGVAEESVEALGFPVSA